MNKGDKVTTTAEIGANVPAGSQGIVRNVLASGAIQVRITHLSPGCQQADYLLPYLPSTFFKRGGNCS